KILETPGGRMYFATDALALNDDLTRSIQSGEKELEKLGFKHAGDLVCNLFAQIAVRSYAIHHGDTWATFLVAAPNTLVFEMSTPCENHQASLLTSRKAGVRDDTTSHSFRQSVLDGDYAEMWERHKAKLMELTQSSGPTIKTEPTLSALADAVEAALKKQLGG